MLLKPVLLSLTRGNFCFFFFFFTESEYLLAKSQKCNFHRHDIFIRQLKRLEESTKIKTFRHLLQKVQEQRRDHPKESISNLKYKEIEISI
jgi:hypothetical protein